LTQTIAINTIGFKTAVKAALVVVKKTNFIAQFIIKAALNKHLI
jgi:hypothetical protein